jgi:hypothetical protein
MPPWFNRGINWRHFWTIFLFIVFAWNHEANAASVLWPKIKPLEQSISFSSNVRPAGEIIVRGHDFSPLYKIEFHLNPPHVPGLNSWDQPGLETILISFSDPEAKDLLEGKGIFTIAQAIGSPRQKQRQFKLRGMNHFFKLHHGGAPVYGGYPVLLDSIKVDLSISNDPYPTEGSFTKKTSSAAVK